mgnify:CR=1 FL=1
MADRKISQLTPTTTVDLADKYALARGSGNFYLTYETLQNNLATPTGSFITTVNGVAGDATGNVAVSLASVETGLSSSFPTTPEDGDVYIIAGETATDRTGSNGESFIYSSASADWFRLSGLDEAGNDARYVNVSGDTMTGALTLPADPTVALQAATKQYVDGKTAAGTNSQTLRFNGTTLEATSTLTNDSTTLTSTLPLRITATGESIRVGDSTQVQPTTIQIDRHFGQTGSLVFSRGGVSDDVIIEVNDVEDLQLKYNQASDYKQGDFRIVIDTTNVIEVLATSTDLAFNGKLTNVTNPTASQDAATKNYADNIVYTAPIMYSGAGTGTSGNYTAGSKLSFNVDVDTNSGWSTNTYTIPEDGVYEIFTSLRFGIDTANDKRAAIMKNTGHIRIIECPQNNPTGVYASRTLIGHIITSLVTGDEISVQAFQTTSNFPNVSENGLSIRKLRN